MIRDILVFTFLMSAFCSPLPATTYYVANAGNDANAGTSSTTAWKSVARVNSASFAPGDAILFNRGDVWREQLVPPSTGASGNPITYSAYGTGANPIISGADLVSRWTNSSGSIWTASVAIQPQVVFVGGSPGVQQASVLALTAAGQWSWSSGTLSIYSAAAPGNVEVAQRNYALLIGENGSGSYTTISGIDFRIANLDVIHIVNTTGDIINGGMITGGYQFGLFAIGVGGSSVNHLQITNNTVSLNGSSGIEISSGHNHVTIQSNLAFSNAYNGQNSGNFQFMAGIYLYDNSRTANYDLVEKNVSSNNGVAGGNESQGGGIWLDTLMNSTVQNNVAYGNWAHGVFLEKNTNSVMANNISYSNAAAPNSANITCYASYGTPAIGNTVTGNASWGSKGIGLKTGAYQGGGITQFSNNTFRDNVIVNSQAANLLTDPGADNDGAHGTGNVFVNNTVATVQ